MQKSFLHYLRIAGVAALAIALGTSAFAQGLTSSSITGFVSAQGKPVVGATVTVVHTPTGSHYTAITRTGGDYNVAGLIPGGPYTVTAAATGFAPQSKENIYVDAGATANADIAVSAEVIQLAAVTVSTSRDSTFDSSAMGTGISLSSDAIGMVSSVRRDIQDMQNLDSRVLLQQASGSDAQYQLSAQGQNFRENLFLVDGVSATDNFGLNSNAYAGLRNPVPPDWLGGMTFDLNPYEITYSGFLGAVLNATLKTGTNTFTGTMYEIYTGTRFRGPDPVYNQMQGQHEPIRENTTGFTIGGPILKNKLFFFIGYDAFREIASSPAVFFNPLDTSANASVINQIVSTAISKYGYNPGTLAAPNHIWQQNAVGKIDWNILPSQKFELTFRHTDGANPVYVNYTYTNGTSFSNAWYNSHRTDQSYTAKLNSDWSALLQNFSTEIEATYKRYNGTAFTNGPLFPAVVINNVAGTNLSNNSPVTNGDVILGTNNSYQYNALWTKELEGHVFGQYSLGNHTFKFGGQFDRTQYLDLYIQNYIGSYGFANLQDWINGTPTGVTLATPAPGFTVASDNALYALTDFVGLVQDIWRPSSNFTMSGGVRIDYPWEPGRPVFSPVFYNAYGYRNNTTMSGNYTISPRLGMNYALPKSWLPSVLGGRKTQIRGGIGLFMGQNPAVYLSNSFDNAGQLGVYSAGSLSSNTAAPIANYTFTGANLAAQPLPPVAVSVPVATFNTTNPNFHWPSNWKGNVAVDHELPFLGLIVTVEYDWTKVNKDLFYLNNNFATASSGAATLPDGRIRYAGAITPGSGINTAYQIAGFTYSGTSSVSGSTVLRINQATGPVYDLLNTDKGGSQEYTLNLRRPMKDHWAFSFSYSHSHATQVSSTTSSVAQSNYTGQTFVNPNDNVPYTSDYVVPDKFVVTAAHEFDFFKVRNSRTLLSAQIIAQTGRPYSFTFAGDADGAGMNSGRCLFYVPTGPNDPNVAWASSAEETSFFQFLSANPDLSKWAGKIVPRNSVFSPWQKTVNLHIEQQIPIYRRARLTVFADCFNFANLLSKNWGVVQIYDFPYYRTIAGTWYNLPSAPGKYTYTFNPSTLSNTTIYPDGSRWMVQVGARLEF